MPARLVFVAGKDPLRETGGGHSAYVRSWARAATAAGRRPDIFAVSRERGVVETEYGTIHRVPSPLRWLPDRDHTGFRMHTLAWHGTLLARAITTHVLDGDRGRPTLLHGFGCWAVTGVHAARRLRRHGAAATVLASSYTLMRDEYVERLRGTRAVADRRHEAMMLWELLMLRLVLQPSERTIWREADGVLVNYRRLGARLVEAGARPSVIRHVPYAAERAFMPASGSTAAPPELPAGGGPLVVSVSRHDARKGLATLLHAFARLARDGVPFRAVLLGGGPLFETHRRLRDRLGLASRVAVTGFVADLEPWWHAADVFVLPSHQEGSGSLSLLEAMQDGKAIVAADIDGIPEDVEDDRSALLVPPRDVGALATALERVVTDDALRARLGAGARAAFERRFSASAMTDAVRALYDELG